MTATLRVVDPHVHFWNIDRLIYPWLRHPVDTFMGDYRDLQRNYGPSDLLHDAADIEVLRVVHVDAGHDPADPLSETRWLQALADAPDGAGLPNAIVAYADLSRPDAAALLAAHAAFRNVRGIRQILNVHDDAHYDYVGRHFMHDPQWQANFGLLHEHGLSFDLQIYPTQMSDAAALAMQHPHTTLVVNHLGMFVDRNHVSGWRAWRDGLRALAAQPNVAIKLSGQGMIDHHWTRESLRPYVLEAIDAFGSERCMFASNFPVDSLYGSYPDLWRAYAGIVSGFAPAEQAALFRDNADRIYRLVPAPD